MYKYVVGNKLVYKTVLLSYNSVNIRCLLVFFILIFFIITKIFVTLQPDYGLTRP